MLAFFLRQPIYFNYPEKHFREISSIPDLAKFNTSPTLESYFWRDYLTSLNIRINYNNLIIIIIYARECHYD